VRVTHSELFTGVKVKLLKNLMINLFIIIIIFIGLYLLFPKEMRQIFYLYGQIFGPIVIILLLVVAAWPRKS
jgi:hypothetical protein